MFIVIILVCYSGSCFTVIIFYFFQVAVYLRTVSAVTTEHGAPEMTSSLMANTVLSVGLVGLVGTA